MTLIILTVVVIGFLIAILAIYLFMIGVLLNRTASNLGDCLQNVRTIAGQAKVIGPGITRLNKISGDLLGAMPLLIEGAEGVAAKLAPSTAAPSSPSTADPASSTAASPRAVRTHEGYMDSTDSPKGVGYLDV